MRRNLSAQIRRQQMKCQKHAEQEHGYGIDYSRMRYLKLMHMFYKQPIDTAQN